MGGEKDIKTLIYHIAEMQFSILPSSVHIARDQGQDWRWSSTKQFDIEVQSATYQTLSSSRSIHHGA